MPEGAVERHLNDAEHRRGRTSGIRVKSSVETDHRGNRTLPERFPKGESPLDTNNKSQIEAARWKRPAVSVCD